MKIMREYALVAAMAFVAGFLNPAIGYLAKLPAALDAKTVFASSVLMVPIFLMAVTLVLLPLKNDGKNDWTRTFAASLLAVAIYFAATAEGLVIFSAIPESFSERLYGVAKTAAFCVYIITCAAVIIGSGLMASAEVGDSLNARQTRKLYLCK